MVDRIRAAREHRGWSQQQLADRAGLSRQQVSAVEAGRHAPSVTAALALARALDATVEHLFADATVPSADVLGGPAPAGTSVSTVRVGESLIAVPLVRSIPNIERWAVADAVVADDAGLAWLPDADVTGVLIAGCDPLLGLVEQVVTRAGRHRLVVAHASTGRAIAALAAGRVHGVVVHAAADALPEPPVPVLRLRLARWRVGLAGREQRDAPLLDRLLEQGADVVQRESGASSQRAFEQAVRAAGGTTVPGPLADGHVDAALRVLHGVAEAAVTMEAAAEAFGLSFSAFEEHQAELWLDRQWIVEPATRHLLDVLASGSFRRQAVRLPGYDLSGCGSTSDSVGSP